MPTKTFRHATTWTGGALLWLAAAGIACAQPYPAKPLRIVVPYTAGGPADVLVRALGQKLTDTWGAASHRRKPPRRE